MKRTYKNLLYEAQKHVPRNEDGSVSNADLENYMVERLPQNLSESARRSSVKAFMREYFAGSDRTWRAMFPFFHQRCEEQRSKGRASSELTFGNFAEEWAIPRGLMRACSDDFN